MLTSTYLDRFQGIGRLYGLAGLRALHQSHVMVVGLGGVGSWTAEALARTGVGRLTLVDLDEICLTNTNRQIHALEGTYGKQKVEVVADRLQLINPEIILQRSNQFYSEQNAQSLLSTAPQVVVDAIDSVRAKCHLLAQCVDQDISVVCSGAAGGKTEPSHLRIADLAHTQGDALLQSVRRILRTEYHFPKAESKRATPFQIPTVYSVQAPQAPLPCRPEDLQADPSPLSGPRNLNCASGYGAVTHLTASFGMFLASETISLILSAS